MYMRMHGIKMFFKIQHYAINIQVSRTSYILCAYFSNFISIQQKVIFTEHHHCWQNETKQTHLKCYSASVTKYIFNFCSFFSKKSFKLFKKKNFCFIMLFGLVQCNCKGSLTWSLYRGSNSSNSVHFQKISIFSCISSLKDAEIWIDAPNELVHNLNLNYNHDWLSGLPTPFKDV